MIFEKSGKRLLLSLSPFWRLTPELVPDGWTGHSLSVALSLSAIQ